MVNKQLLIVGHTSRVPRKISKKIFLLGAIFFVLSVLLINNALALSCSLKQTCTTPNPGEGVLMALSSQDNAHGEIRDGGGNYPWKVCCDFEGTDVCNSKNNILSLSDITNAHAELLGQGNYNNDVCFGALECVNITGTDCNTDNGEFEIVSFSGDTNAHLGGFDDYSQKVCCKWQASAYFADADDINAEKTTAAVGDRVVLVLDNSGLSLGSYQGFQIFENDGGLNPNDDILPRDGGQIIIGDVVSVGGQKSILSGVWEITQEDYDAGKDLLVDRSPDEFYFNVNGITSPYLEIVSRDEGAAFCGDFDAENLCVSCSNHVDCSAAYNSANDVSKDTYGVGCGEILLDDDHYNTNCFCQWDSGTCGTGVSVISIKIPTVVSHCKNNETDLGEDGIDCNFPETVGAECGICENGMAISHCVNDIKDDFGENNISNEEGIDCGGTDCGDCSSTISFPKPGSWTYSSQDEDDCDDGFLEYSWVGNWTWGADNGFTSDINNGFPSDPLDYVVGDDGLFYYDPTRSSEKSSEGHQTIPCPAQIQLPFFGFFSVIASLALIALIYLSLIFKNKDNF